ncbi:AlpA family transcriptional regulator [Pseudomonas sp. UMAB-08]|uniref:helix-turn-helix transcriptional regulator n=1 Tax=Pseudomonas sp. UMAB-08 TaxID=1365375 RepID=UPI001C588D8C|nr:AlpA family phage regulatory protein [Pseudomonas sp. UMAB-08]
MLEYIVDAEQVTDEVLQPYIAIRVTTFSTTEVYRRIGKGQFPRQIKIGAKSVVWVEQEVMAWIDLMIAHG